MFDQFHTMRWLFFCVIISVLLVHSCDCFGVLKPQRIRLKMKLQQVDGVNERLVPRSPNDDASLSISKYLRIAKVAAITLATTVATSNGFVRPAKADTSLEAANRKLSDYGLPPVLFVPPGFSTVVSEYGRGGLREGLKNPLLVQFSYPGQWVVVTTSVNNNGEAGTISAGDYMKGDSAFFYTSPLPSDQKLSVDNKSLIKKHISKALSQKGNDVLDNLAIQTISKGSSGVDGQEYVYVDFSYDLNTEAGFLISRRGSMSITSVGKALQSIAAVTTSGRYSKLASTLKDIATSFRVYRLNSGIFAAEIPDTV